MNSDKAREPDDKLDAAQARLAALVAVARYHGVDLDRGSFPAPPGEVPSAAALVAWTRENGLWAKATRLRWRQLMRMQSDAPLVLLFADGGAGILVSRDADAGIVYLKDPSRPGDEPVAVDELRLANLWQGTYCSFAASEERPPTRSHSRSLGLRASCCKSAGACGRSPLLRSA